MAQYAEILAAKISMFEGRQGHLCAKGRELTGYLAAYFKGDDGNLFMGETVSVAPS